MRSFIVAVVVAAFVVACFAQQVPQPAPETPSGQFHQYPSNNQGYNSNNQGYNSQYTTQRPYGSSNQYGTNQYGSTTNGRFFNAAPSASMSAAALMTVVCAYLFAH